MTHLTSRGDFLGMVGSAALAAPLAKPLGDRPNIVLIIADQHRGDALGVAGSAIVRTPSLDALAKDGVYFASAYTTMALCSPARTSMMTGLYPHAHKIVGNTHGAGSVSSEVAPSHPMWSELLTGVGYDVGYVGKWDIGTLQAGDLEGRPLPNERGGRHRWTPLDYGFRKAVSAHRPYRTDQLLRVSPLHLELALEQSGLTGGPAPFYATVDVAPENSSEADVADKAIGFLKSYSDSGQRGIGRPFALTVSWASPHFPNYVPEPYASMYDPVRIEPWPSFGDRFENKPFANQRLRDAWGVRGVPWSEWSRIVAHYYAMISHVDAQIGRVIAELDRLNLADDTIVAYVSDHGDLTGAHGLFNKGGVPYEEIYHVPLIVRMPKSPAVGTRVDRFVRNMDLMPTILEAAGIAVPDHLHARSLMPYLAGNANLDGPDEVFMEFNSDIVGLYASRILRTRRFKLVYNIADRNELYDLSADPYELHNVYNVAGYASDRRVLAQRLLAWMRETNDPAVKPAHVILQDDGAM